MSCSFITCSMQNVWSYICCFIYLESSLKVLSEIWKWLTGWQLIRKQPKQCKRCLHTQHHQTVTIWLADCLAWHTHLIVPHHPANTYPHQIIPLLLGTEVPQIQSVTLWNGILVWDKLFWIVTSANVIPVLMPVCSSYHAPSNKPKLVWVVGILPKLPHLCMLFICS